MIAALAIVPSPPMLLPDNVGRIDPIPELRAVCHEVVGDVDAACDRVVAIVGSDPDRRHTGPSLGVRVARELLGRDPDGVVEVPWDAGVAQCRAVGEAAVAATGVREQRVGLVVVADGCATRTEKAPGHLDPRAAAVDAAWLRALGGREVDQDSPAPMRARALAEVAPIDADSLLALDPALARDLWFAGRAPLQALAGALLARGGEPGPTAYRLVVGDPFGVRYVVLAAR